jgi:hypothetical protein
MAAANSYSVGASIPYDPPTQAAIFDPAIDGATVHNALFTLSGTCQLMNPQAVVSIVRGSTAIGSAPCTGSFNLQVMLTEGTNTFVARTANASNLYGPDSTSVIVTLVLPPNPPAPGDTSPEPSSPAQEITATNAGAATGLSIAPDQPFSVMSSANDVTITVTVGGGEHPYDIVLNWGDGSVDSHHVDTAGSYSFTHQDQSAGAYKVHGRVRDVLGAYSDFEYAVLTAAKLPADTKPPIAGNNQPGGIDWNRIKPYAIVGGFIGAMAATYWLGWHVAVKQLGARLLKANPRTPRRKR